MMKIRKNILIGIVALGLGAGSLSAYAEKADCGPMMRGEMGDRLPGERMKKRMEERQADLQAKLKLRPEQQMAWTAYIEKMKPAARTQRPGHAEMENLPAPERMEKMLEMMKEHEKRLMDRIAATKEFYAVLTPEQQKIFNDEFGRGHRYRRHYAG